MNTNSKILYDGILFRLYKQLKSDNIITVRGKKTVEELNFTETFSSDTGMIEINKIFKTSIDYIEHESHWYESKNPNDVYIKEYAKIWEATSDDRGMVNSNYGYLLYSPQNGYQYDNVLKELKKDPYSRRAVAYYTNPFIHYTGGNDHICTAYVSYTIRSNRLIAIVSMRSNDMKFGLIGADLEWQISVQKRLANDLSIETGDMHWHSASAHIYERHFEHLIDLYEK